MALLDVSLLASKEICHHDKQILQWLTQEYRTPEATQLSSAFSALLLSGTRLVICICQIVRSCGGCQRCETSSTMQLHAIQ
jgi:hypothetical protein